MRLRTIRQAAVLLCVMISVAAVAPRSPESVTAQASPGTIAYVRANTGDEIRLIEPDGRNDRRLWAHGLADQQNVHQIRSLTWRPNAAELAFNSTHENWCSLNHADIFVVAADGSGYRRVTEAPACGALATYPKGTVQIPLKNSTSYSFSGFVYFQGAPSAQQVSLPPGGSGTLTFNNVADFGANELQVATLIEGANRYVTLGTAVDVQTGGIVRTGTMYVFSPYAPWEVHSPTWRSDGSKIGYILNFNSLRQIAPRPAPLDFGEDLQSNQSEMPDFADLLVWGPTTATANQLLYAGNIAFDSEGIYRITQGSATAGERLVTHEVYENIRGLAWLPDGSGFIYTVEETEFYESVRANLFEYSFATGNTRRITDLPSDFAGQLSIAPDGQRIVFERSAEKEGGATDLWLVNRDGSGLQLLVSNGSAPAWSPGALRIPERAFLPLILR